MPSKNKSLKKIYDNNPYLVIGVGVSALLLIYVIYVLSNAIFLKPETVDTTGVAKSSDNSNYLTKEERKLDGVFVSLPQISLNNPLAVMIENHPDARPQAGLDDASVVFEAPVEGGITRFMAIYPPSMYTTKIGPVRSARPYYIDWAMGFDALYWHVGGSPEALERIEAGNVLDVDQFYDFQYFWRSEDRDAPHNVYTSHELISRARRDKSLDFNEADYTGWLYEDGVAATENLIQSIDLNFSLPEYQVAWVYNPDHNVYVRYQAGDKHVMEDGSLITADNVVVLMTTIEIIDEEGRRKITTVGTGEAVVFKNGTVYKNIDWRKNKRSQMLRFYNYDSDNEGEEFVFNRGKTWIEVMDDDMIITY